MPKILKRVGIDTKIIMFMRKTIFAVLAAFVMSLAFVSCSSSPEDKVESTMEEMVSFIKGFHIKSADDLNKLTDKMATFKNEIEGAIEELTTGKSPEELMKLAEQMESLEKKMTKLTADMEKEAERLESEAKEAGLDLDNLESLFD